MFVAFLFCTQKFQNLFKALSFLVFFYNMIIGTFFCNLKNIAWKILKTEILSQNRENSSQLLLAFTRMVSHAFIFSLGYIFFHPMIQFSDIFPSYFSAERQYLWHEKSQFIADIKHCIFFRSMFINVNDRLKYN